jgi:hypothetical protein
MRKILSAASALILYASSAVPVFADPLDAGIRPDNVAGRVIAPDTPIGAIVSFVVAFIVVIAFLATLLFIVIGAFQWITSGGDKSKVEAARNHIIAAVIGLVIIALSFVIINVVITALGLGNLTNLQIPTLQDFTR